MLTVMYNTEMSITWAISIGLSTLLAYFFKNLYRQRMLVKTLIKQGLPVAPNHNFLFGHLLYLKRFSDAMPKGAHFQYMFSDIYQESFQDGGVFYLDMWPLSPLFLAVVSPTTATSVTQTNSKIYARKPDLLPKLFKPLAGGPNLFDMPEVEWKPWRATFSKCFSNEHFMYLVPGIVEQTLVYCETLRRHAEMGDTFFLDTMTIRFTMDIIGKTILNSELGAQRGYNPLADCMISQMRWQQPNGDINPFSLIHLPRFFMQWLNGRRMDSYIGPELDKRFREHRASPPDSKKNKAIIDLLLQAYSPNSEATPNQEETMDPEFRLFAIRQIRMFVFAGHDSTSSAITYCFHLLSRHPKALQRLRAEHDETYGMDISSVASKLLANPALANGLLYTTAVIKEALRLFPPASSSRQGTTGVEITDDRGMVCPTEGAVVWVNHQAMHRAPKYWVRPDDFLPERWLVSPDHELYPMKGAWRPFENGPRNCIGQGLVMMELRIVLSLTVREFLFEDAYEEFDARGGRKGIKNYKGERAFQIDEGAAHPAEYYPCKVKLNV